ncbi:hypothetical protein AAIB33_17320 [Microbacterium sp. AZCO]|uniref:hypothetical protein n=1 Tax=Microbacterium sp. AZCO TaxID=3142976 RepID=UPI0031F46FDA
MSLADLLSGLVRRWYITFPGIILAVAAAIGVWYVVPPGYERTATQLLLPGAQSMPASSNPLLYLGGLSNAADVLVRAVGSKNVVGDIKKEYPGVDVEVTRDASTAGPIILITVTAPSDAKAVAALDDLVIRTAGVLADLQNEEHILNTNRITVVPITVDEKSVLQERNRLVAVFAVGLAIAGLSILIAGLVDGVLRRRRRRHEADAARARGAEGDEGEMTAPGEPPADEVAPDLLPEFDDTAPIVIERPDVLARGS